MTATCMWAHAPVEGRATPQDEPCDRPPTVTALYGCVREHLVPYIACGERHVDRRDTLCCERCYDAGHITPTRLLEVLPLTADSHG